MDADNFVFTQIRDVALGLVYLHACGIVHGDLKAVIIHPLQSFSAVDF